MSNSVPEAATSARAARAARLRAFATGLLLLMALLLLLATWAIRAVHPGFVWVQAFAEAALVGGLADWFAVTALFRRPMGLPIPHTAIIPRSKDRIGDTLAAFLRANFLTPQVVARRLDGFDAAAAVAGFLENPGAGGRVRRSAVKLVGQLAETPAAAAILGRVQRGAVERLAETDVAPLLGRLLEAMIAGGRHRAVVDALIGWAARTLDAQEGLIRRMVEERTAWLLRLLSVDERVADAIVEGLRGLLRDLAEQPDHPVRIQADQAIADFAMRLQQAPELRARIEGWKREIMANPAVGQWLDGLWGQARAAVGTMLSGGAGGELSAEMAAALRSDPALRAAINQLARRAVVGIVADHGAAIVRLVSDTVRGWDTATITARLEAAVSRDLQYIRFNGTLIGGLIGLGLHAVLALAR